MGSRECRNPRDRRRSPRVPAVRNRGQLAHHRFPRPRLPGKMPRARAIFVHRFTLKGIGAVAHHGVLGLTALDVLCLLPAPSLVYGGHIGIINRRVIIVDGVKAVGSVNHVCSFRLTPPRRSKRCKAFVRPAATTPAACRCSKRYRCAVPSRRAATGCGFCSPPAPASARCAS